MDKGKGRPASSWGLDPPVTYTGGPPDAIIQISIIAADSTHSACHNDVSTAKTLPEIQLKYKNPP